MDDSDDNKNKRKIAIQSHWMESPFERVNHSTNFEDYACSSDDTKLLFTSDSMASNVRNILKPMHETNKESFSQSINKMSNKTKFETSVTPMISSYLSEQKDHPLVESCLSAGNSSAEVTPSGTPQSSPYTLRKVIESNNKVKMLANEKNNNSLNPKRWFYSGFFLNNDTIAQQKPIVNNKPNNQITKNLSFKNLCVSNFDINAVGPTSW